MLKFESATAYPLFYRSYSRMAENKRESWQDVIERNLKGLSKLGKLTEQEIALVASQMAKLRTFPSGRWLWVGGTPWLEKPQNFIGAYNCSSQPIDSIRSIGRLIDMAMQGTGTGAVLTKENIEKLPTIRRKINVNMRGEFGEKAKEERLEHSRFTILENSGYLIEVGDSRQGWVSAYTQLLYLSTGRCDSDLDVIIDVSNVRQKGEKLKGFGGVANPSRLKEVFPKIAKILNKATGRKLNSLELCLVIDEMALVIVSGNIRRSANIKQFDADDAIALTAKDNLWQQDTEGNWRIDPEKDALRMSNHTRVFFKKPTLEEVTSSVRKQFYSGEGAIQYAPEAIARSSADIIRSPIQKRALLDSFEHSKEKAREWLKIFGNGENDTVIDHRMQRFGLNPCGEIQMHDNLCNLSEVHLNNINPFLYKEQEEAFRAAAIIVASLLHHNFVEEEQQFSREIDPIVAVSFTGLFDFFVNAYGVRWLEWWQEGRPENWGSQIYLADFESVKKREKIEGKMVRESEFFRKREQDYLSWWSEVVHSEVERYCNEHDLNIPNRCTTVQPAGSKSLLTGASPGWHPPKSAYYIRRMTFAKDDSIALACRDYGYSIIPSQSDKDENGNLLNNPDDERCTEWLVEIPCKTHWSDLPGVENIDISKFSALSQFDFFMQVQKYYTTFNTSATIELREAEIEPLSKAIYEAIDNGEGYISTALLARFDDMQTYPRLPFEPIDKADYDDLMNQVLARRQNNDFEQLIARYSINEEDLTGPAPCDSDKCLFASESKNNAS